jgi:hypothetical protein
MRQDVVFVGPDEVDGRTGSLLQVPSVGERVLIKNILYRVALVQWDLSSENWFSDEKLVRAVIALEACVTPRL